MSDCKDSFFFALLPASNMAECSKPIVGTGAKKEL